MIFRPELAAKVMAGEKTVTRRRLSDNPRSPWSDDRCAYEVARDYAVQPGRGQPAIGRVRIVSVRQEQLRSMTEAEARKEGVASIEEFIGVWEKINGHFDPDEWVWRLEFEAL